MTAAKVTRAAIDRMADETGVQILLADGFDGAIVGVVENHRGMMAVYDTSKMIDILISEGMSPEDAAEHLEFNVFNAAVGDAMPVYTVDTSRWADEVEGAGCAKGE